MPFKVFSTPLSAKHFHLLKRLFTITGVSALLFVGSLLGSAIINRPMSVQSQQIVVAEEQAVINAVKKSKPAVVSIVASKVITIPSQRVFQFPNDFMNDPFSQIPQQQTPPRQEERQVGTGTGFIVDATGMIVTNNHVAGDKSATYKVFLNDGRSLPATLMAADPANDIAVLKIQAPNLPTLPLGNSDAIEVGQTVVAIGNSLGRYQNTVTRGVISGTGRNVVAGDNRGGSEELTNILQTDAAINPGNSGGPLINTKGEVVGMNTAVDLQGQSIGFAIPINIVKQIVTSVRTTGKIIRPWLGVRFVMITPEIRSQLQIPVSEGALLVKGTNSEPAVVETSPAFQAGLREGDVVQTIDTEKLQNNKTLPNIIARHKVGDTLKLKVLRGGKTINVEVKLGEAP